MIMNKNGGQANTFLPVWVWSVLMIQVLLVLFFSIGTALNPGEFIPGISELNYVAQLYVTRNVTAAVGILIAMLLKSYKGLITILAVRLLTDIADVVTVFALDVEAIKSSVPMVVVLLILPSLFAIGYLWKRVK